MKYRVVADSSSNLFSFENLDYICTPLTVIVDGKQFVDNGLVNITEMEEALNASKEKTGSSCPNTYQWEETFEGADAVFIVTMTGTLSGTYNAAKQAAEGYMEQHPEVKIHVIDSLSTGPEMVLLVEKLKELIDENKDFETIRDEITEYQKHTHLLFTLQSLKNLAKNGRINPSIAKLLGLLGINIVGRASAEGTLELIDKCRGPKKAIRLLMNELEKNGFNGRKIRIAHNHNLEGAGNVKMEILSKYPFADVMIMDCGALDAYYAEENGMLIGFEDALN